MTSPTEQALKQARELNGHLEDFCNCSRCHRIALALTTTAAAGREEARQERATDLFAKITAERDTLRSQLAGAKREIETWKMHAYDHGYQP